MGPLVSKLPLIFIVARESCIMNRQIGIGDSKYGVGRDPLFTGHMTQPNFPAKTAYNGDAHISKLPLVFIVAP